MKERILEKQGCIITESHKHSSWEEAFSSLSCLKQGHH